jgi:uncharacterized membrane protein YdjX (TVP38/TMEM64 family)
MQRWIILAVLLAVAVALYQLGLKDYLSLEAIKAQQADFASAYAENPVFVIGIYFLVYVVSTALSLPGAAILTLLGGALFGLVTGTLIVSFASSIGATLAFLGSRYLLRDWVQAKFGDRLKAVNDGVAKDGAFYLFTLRLIPAIPFFLINLAMGLTPIKTRTFYWVSQVGMFLGTIVFVNAGTQLAQIGSLGDIASPTLLASFVALGLLPWIARAIMQVIMRVKGDEAAPVEMPKQPHASASAPSTKPLVMVYNAEEGTMNAIMDSAHKLFSPGTYQCSLCAITHGMTSMRNDWKIYLDTMPVETQFYHRTDFQEKWPSQRTPLPAIFELQADGSLQTLLSAEELRQPSNVGELIALLEHKRGGGLA